MALVDLIAIGVVVGVIIYLFDTYRKNKQGELIAFDAAAKRRAESELLQKQVEAEIEKRIADFRLRKEQYLKRKKELENELKPK